LKTGIPDAEYEFLMVDERGKKAVAVSGGVAKRTPERSSLSPITLFNKDRDDQQGEAKKRSILGKSPVLSIQCIE
jgi:hypothetical protein